MLETGALADAQIMTSIAGVDLIHGWLRALLASVDTAARMTSVPPAAE